MVTAVASESFVIRRARTRDELADAFDVAGAQIDPPVTRADRRIRSLLDRFDEDRPLMQLALCGDQIIGAALAFNATLRLMGVEVAYRRRGVGRRLLQTVEVEAMSLGLDGLALGAEKSARSFYESLGYHGRHKMMQKQFPPAGRVRDLRLLRAVNAIGDFDSGVRFTVPRGTGIVPALEL
jgi:GNAT superfamily N-acetyltransferase